MRLIEDVDCKAIPDNAISFCMPGINGASFWYPEFVELSAWLEHAPFAFWITSTFKPRTFVELGTHSGYSYFAFCQAVKNLWLDTRCYAIDTWMGDEHAGFYGEEVFQCVQKHNEAHYAAFSRLVRATFDEALSYFSDQSVDLLHMDGRHFYEDVKHDFEVWRPKLSEGAVVLFHDTNVRERDFGVFRLWEELAAQYPTFEFLHGNGLGVLGYGAALSPEVKSFFTAAADPTIAAELRRAYSRLGSAIKADFDARQVREHFAGRIAEQEAKISAYADEIQSRDAAAQEAAVRLMQWEAEVEQMTARLAEADAEMQDLVAQQVTRIDALEGRYKALQCELAESNSIVDSLKTQLAALEGSTFWRMTAPMRATLSATPPSVRRIVRRSAKAAYWTVTPHRLSERVRFLRERKQHPAIAQHPASHTNILLSAPLPPPAAVPAISRILNEELKYLSALPVFRIPERDRQRVTIVTDSINSGSFFGGVATSLILAALMARRRSADLRIVTLNEPAATENVAQLFSCHDVAWQDNIAFSFVDLRGQHKPVDVAENDFFITTSWWSTHIANSAIPAEKIVYILQEDERMFYSLGDQHLRCSEILHNPNMWILVNTKMLYEHLIASGLEHLRDRGCWFEPSFPQSIYFREENNKPRKRFFFYARPHHPRNLYLRGLEAIRRAFDLNIFDPREWDVVFAGSNIPNIEVSDVVKVEIAENLPWRKYAKLLRGVDLGLSLMYTPHPSYPPLDLAASGAIVVTNRFGPKQDLNHYSENIIMADSDVDSLVEGLRRGVQLAADKTQRQANYERNGLLRDWHASFEPALDFLFDR